MRKILSLIQMRESFAEYSNRNIWITPIFFKASCIVFVNVCQKSGKLAGLPDFVFTRIRKPGLDAEHLGTDILYCFQSAAVPLFQPIVCMRLFENKEKYCAIMVALAQELYHELRTWTEQGVNYCRIQAYSNIRKGISCFIQRDKAYYQA